ncbi:MAG: NAD(+) synthase [Velocimicrobium sp.]
MRDGFVKVCAATPKIRVADCQFNGTVIKKMIEDCEAQNVKLIVFPELCITGYTCSDLFLQDTLLREAYETLDEIKESTKDKDILCVVGLPVMIDNKLYNIAAVLHHGCILGMVPKTNIPNYSEFYEARHFQKGNKRAKMWNGILVGTDLLFQCDNLPGFVLSLELCEDVWVPMPPSTRHALAGATVIANLSASDEITGKDSYRRELIKGQSGRLVCAYLYADAGEGESSTDLVFAAHNFIVENGTVIKESKRFENESIVGEIDLGRLSSERRRMTTFEMNQEDDSYTTVSFTWNMTNTELTRTYETTPFVPSQKRDRDRRCQEILNIQALGLKKRLEHTNCECAVLGISGGLDSTLALLVTVRAFDMLHIPREKIMSITMPCFGTSNRTYQNAISLARELRTTLKEIPIKDAVELHFQDIEQPLDLHDVTYENGQARERTQVLMDLANKYNGLVIGTGDMSELALGWATYNGDHMSMYGVNVSVPKTLVRYLVLYYAETVEEGELKDVLFDILDTPVSPELLPPKDGEIAQKTEDIVGPYELHDFFLYHIMRFGYEPKKVYRLAKYAFANQYEDAVIYKWLCTFYRRFFSQQFKRSCLPDGPKVGSVALSPRGDLRMPSDASVTAWMRQLDEI